MKKICAILLALVLILTLAACGGKETDQNSLVIWHDKEDAVAKVLEELGKDYVTGARARGIPFSVTLWKSVLRCCLSTILTLLSLSIGNLLGGTAIVESIFMWDGVGKMAVDAINMRDYPVIQAYVVWMAVIYVAVNLITDISYRLWDPRIRLGGDAR